MRIVGGRLKGRALAAPRDARVRPTSDRVREAVFNILQHNDFDIGFALDGVRVLDLFAGTGALGIEALSRGAAFALFIDDHADSRALIRDNVEAFNLTGVTKIWRRDASALGTLDPKAGAPFGLIFLDPPYRRGLVATTLSAALAGGWIAPQAIVVAESEAEAPPLTIDGLTVADTRSYGETRVDILVRDNARPSS